MKDDHEGPRHGRAEGARGRSLCLRLMGFALVAFAFTTLFSLAHGAAYGVLDGTFRGLTDYYRDVDYLVSLCFGCAIAIAWLCSRGRRVSLDTPLLWAVAALSSFVGLLLLFGINEGCQREGGWWIVRDFSYSYSSLGFFLLMAAVSLMKKARPLLPQSK